MHCFTDPKCFLTFDENGNSTLVRDDNGRPVRDENGNYVFRPGGCVLGSIINHATSDNKSNKDYVFPQKYKDAYYDLTGSAEHPDDYYLYIYYPSNFNPEDNSSFQCLLSARQVEPEQVTISVRFVANLF